MVGRVAPGPHPIAATGVAVSGRAAVALATTKRWEEHVEILPGLELGDVVAVGATVGSGDVLVALREGERDRSARCKHGRGGTVVEVDRRAKTKQEPSAIDIVVESARPLAIGDVLELADGTQNVVAAIEPALDADLVWPGKRGELEVNKVACAVDRLHARSIGPYSLVTQQPLSAKESFGGQRISMAQLEALRARGTSWLAYELLTVKCDDVTGRVDLYESIVRGTPTCVAGVPRSARVLEGELRALGFVVDFDADEIGIALYGDDLLCEHMPGVVTKPETINYRTLHPERGGLFDEQVFGELGSDDRWRRLGRLELAIPLLHPWAVEEAARVLGLTDQEVTQILYCKRTLAGGTPEAWEETGAVALAAALAGEAPQLCFRNWPVLPPDLRPLVPIGGGRFATSDLNDLYRRLINRNNRLRRLLELNAPPVILINEMRQLQDALDSLVENGLRGDRVRGPNRRPLMSLAELFGGEHGHLTFEYRRVDYSAFGSLVPRSDVDDGRIRVPRDAAFELFTPFVYHVLERDHHVDSIRAAKRFVASPNPISFAALDEVVATRPLVTFGDGVVLALEIELWDEAAFAVSPATHASLAAADHVVVHLPIDPRAVAEARRLPATAPAAPPIDGGWLSRAAAAPRVGPVLMAAALAGEVDPARDPRARRLLGRRIP